MVCFVFVILQDTGNNIWILLEIEYHTSIGRNISLTNNLAGKSLYSPLLPYLRSSNLKEGLYPVQLDVC